MTTARRSVTVVYGTRPEAIKLAPVVRALAEDVRIDLGVVVTGQHRAMLDQVDELFGIVPDVDLDVLRPRQGLPDLTGRVLAGVTTVLAGRRPDALVIQGDTTTAFATALAAFYAGVAVVHVEAGLRTHSRYDPFPEELNRRLISQIATLHLAPTPAARDNLVAAGVPPADVAVTGNTVIDALLDVIGQHPPIADRALAGVLAREGDLVLVTAHRRESWGAPMARTAAAVARLARRFPEVCFVVPAHLNPAVREILLPPLAAIANVLVTEPLSYGDFAQAMAAATLVLTDSGGVQEEAPSLGIPVLVLRNTTERPEAVAAGTVRLIGTDTDRIVGETTRLLVDPAARTAMAHTVNPYGDGHAAPRVAAAVGELLGLGERLRDWSPATGREMTCVSP